MFDYFLNLDAQRKRLLKKAPEGPLKEFLTTPFPCPKTAIKDVSFLSLDFETTGLNAKQDKLLSYGYVDIVQQKIQLASANHQVIRCNEQLDRANVAIHQITNQEANAGIDLATAIAQLLKALSGKVMLVHYAKIEQTFLSQACLSLYGMAPVYPIVDTLQIAKRRLDRKDIPYDPSCLRLTNLREQLNLPGHYAHNALNDAIATAELLMVELAHHHEKDAPLKNFLR